MDFSCRGDIFCWFILSILAISSLIHHDSFSNFNYFFFIVLSSVCSYLNASDCFTAFLILFLLSYSAESHLQAATPSLSTSYSVLPSLDSSHISSHLFVFNLLPVLSFLKLIFQLMFTLFVSRITTSSSLISNNTILYLIIFIITIRFFMKSFIMKIQSQLEFYFNFRN